MEGPSGSRGHAAGSLPDNNHPPMQVEVMSVVYPRGPLYVNTTQPIAHSSELDFPAEVRENADILEIPETVDPRSLRNERNSPSTSHNNIQVGNNLQVPGNEDEYNTIHFRVRPGSYLDRYSLEDMTRDFRATQAGNIPVSENNTQRRRINVDFLSGDPAPYEEEESSDSESADEDSNRELNRRLLIENRDVVELAEADNDVVIQPEISNHGDTGQPENAEGGVPDDIETILRNAIHDLRILEGESASMTQSLRSLEDSLGIPNQDDSVDSSLNEFMNFILERLERNLDQRPRETYERILSQINTFILRHESRQQNLRANMERMRMLLNEDSESSTVILMPRGEEEPPSKCAKMESKKAKPEDDEDNDGQICSICLDYWTICGDHRLTALKCGHLFGYTCIDRWLKQSLKSNRTCPTCKTKAASKDMRFIYAKKVTMLDNSEIESLRSELERVKTDRNRAELELQKSELNQQINYKKIKELEKKLLDLQESAFSIADRASRLVTFEASTIKFALVSNVEIVKDESCRVFAFNTRSNELYVSQQSNNNVFPGYGVRKVNCSEQKLGRLLLLHPKLIRDIKYSQENDMLVSVALDKSAKIVNCRTDSVEITLQCETPLWSCCWDIEQSNRLFIGGLGGIVLQYDIRQPKTCLTRIPAVGDVSPVVSLTSIPGGFLSCQLTSFRGHRRTNNDFETKTFMDGSFLCANYEPNSGNTLVSSRPSVQQALCQHIICHINTEELECDKVHSFHGASIQTLMSRSTVMSIADDTFAAAHNEVENAITIWSLKNKKVVQLLGTQDNVIDMCPITIQGETNLATLSKNRVRIYKTKGSNL